MKAIYKEIVEKSSIQIETIIIGIKDFLDFFECIEKKITKCYIKTREQSLDELITDPSSFILNLINFNECFDEGLFEQGPEEEIYLFLTNSKNLCELFLNHVNFKNELSNCNILRQNNILSCEKEKNALLLNNEKLLKSYKEYMNKDSLEIMSKIIDYIDSNETPEYIQDNAEHQLLQQNLDSTVNNSFKFVDFTPEI